MNAGTRLPDLQQMTHTLTGREGAAAADLDCMNRPSELRGSSTRSSGTKHTCEVWQSTATHVSKLEHACNSKRSERAPTTNFVDFFVQKRQRQKPRKKMHQDAHGPNEHLMQEIKNCTQINEMTARMLLSPKKHSPLSTRKAAFRPTRICHTIQCRMSCKCCCT